MNAILSLIVSVLLLMNVWMIIKNIRKKKHHEKNNTVFVDIPLLTEQNN